MPRGRTVVFIDNSNVFHGQQKAGWRIDVKRLHDYLEREGEIWQTFFFASVTDPPRYEQTGFYRFIKNEMRYEVLLFTLGRKTIECRKCGHARVVPVEKGVDVALATKLLTLANNRAFDTAILVAADKDYLDTVRAVKGNGLRVEIVAWRGTISAEMEAESSCRVVYFDDIRADIELTVAPDEEADVLISGEQE
jgi:uncharacterized LabA/DUF88 family protein